MPTTWKLTESRCVIYLLQLVVPLTLPLTVLVPFLWPPIIVMI